MCFPQGKTRAFTVSYDDGAETDFHLAALMRTYGIRGTFNVNSQSILKEGASSEALPLWRRRMHKDRFLEFFAEYGDLVEIASHSFTHALLTELEKGEILSETLYDRRTIEALLKRPCRGFAYPYGGVNQKVLEVISSCGFDYARITGQPKHPFLFPENPLEWQCTCHHNHEDLFGIVEAFFSDSHKARDQHRLFSVWGHSYEFEKNGNWDTVEKLFGKVGGREDVWYATNTEIFRYKKAYDALEFFADSSHVYNPSAIPVSFILFGVDREKKCYITVNPGETVCLK